MVEFNIMWTDVVDLNDFYGSSLGQTARCIIRRRARAMWPNVQGMVVAGMGYATPFLRPFRDEAERVIAVMPAGQGVLHWPTGEPGLVVLSDEDELPLPDLSVDRLLLVHVVESSEQLRAMMREAWRVLSDSGRLLIVVPNRRGIWARLDRTPFGFGHPYSRGQLSRLLRECMFTPFQSARALYMPPIDWKVMLTSAFAIEKIGSRWFPTFAGVLMIEAGKQIYAVTPSKSVNRRERRFVVLPGRAPAARVSPIRDGLRLLTDD
jgi:SAM-dependent methyltransferase